MGRKRTMNKIINIKDIKGNNQWREIVELLNIMEVGLDRLEIYGLYKPHDAKVIRNAIKRGWLKLHNFDEETSQESKDLFNEHFGEKEQ